MATSEIEKLERRYTENPHGLTFAPLAEVHRKSGDVARALELLTAGLELHPNYIPASIVLGRCHQDRGDLPSAEAAFAHVLRLDDENVIALKSLADINERLERFAEAETWLRRLVSVDRSNDEAREQLQRVESAKHGEQGTRAETPAGSQADTPAPALELIDVTPEPAESAEVANPPAELLPVDIAALELSRPAPEQKLPTFEAISGEKTQSPPPEPAAAPAVEEELQNTGEPEREGMTPAEAVMPVEASSPPRPEETSGQEEPVRPLPGLISAEFEPPLEAIGGLGVETSEEVVLEASGESEFQVPDASEDLRSLSARLNSPPPVAPAESRQPVAAQAPKPDPRREAAPDDRAREAQASEVMKGKSYVAAETKGQSVAAFFRALVSARPPLAGDGAPERQLRNSAPASSERGEESSQVAPAVPGGEQKSDSAVSFDDFFNSEADGSSPLRKGNSEAGKNDLDQFQSWLQNLKR